MNKITIISDPNVKSDTIYMSTAWKTLPLGYPQGVSDFRNLTPEQCIELLNQLERDFPNVKKANELRNSKLYKALK